MLQRGQTIEMVLTGGRAGQTVLLNKHSFVKGVCKVYVYPESFDAFLTLMARSYHAYPRGSHALAAAIERDEKNGIQHHLQEDSAPTDGAPAAIQSAGGTASGSVPDPRALHGSADDANPSGSEGLVSGGAGHADAGVGERVEPDPQQQSIALMHAIQTAVQKLDPTVPEQWTEDGLPSVDYVALAVQDQSVTREMISAACPGFDKRQAEDLQPQF
jgi:hypothetical protein